MGKFKKALLLVGDTSSISTPYRDKSSYPLFGDAGTATALVYDENAPDMHFNLQSDGSGWNAIVIPDAGARNHYNMETSYKEVKISEGIYRSPTNVHLDGIKIFNFSLMEVPKNIKKLLSHIDKSIDDVDYLVMHQANKMTNEVIRKKMKVIPEKVPYSLDKLGNTSCATIPITMVTKMQDVLKNKKINNLFTAFGVGLSWGSAWVETENIHVCDLIIEG